MKKYFHFGRYIIFLIGIYIFFFGDNVLAINAKDIENHKYQDSIQYLYDHNVVKGYADGSFGPDREINRAEIMKIILESSIDSELDELKNCFPDVKEERYAKYVCYAKSRNMIKGYDDGNFKPGKTVIIAEALKMGIEGFAKKTNNPSNGDPWYQSYLDFVHNNNIFSKYSILPSKNITRGEMAYLIHKLMLEKKGEIVFNNQRSPGSNGCGKEVPRNTPTSSIINGITRNYITVIGNKYNKNKPIKLIFAFHGRTNPNTMVRSYYGIEKETNGNAIIIYPSGLPENSSPRNRSNPGDKSDQLRDFELFDQLLEEFENKYCIDKDQIFVVGHSLGAWFTNSLSCARGNVIRGVGSVGGGTTINNCNGPVAAITMQHPKDNLSPYSAAVIARDQMLRQNSCGPENTPVGPEPLNCVKYTNCLSDAPVIWCPHGDSTDYKGNYYPHTWPDNAGNEIIKFFESL